MPGYRGMTFAKRAQSLNFSDWNSARDFLVAVGVALDRLESVRDTAGSTELQNPDQNDEDIFKANQN